MFAVLLLVLISGVYSDESSSDPGMQWCLKNPYPFTTMIYKVMKNLETHNATGHCNQTAINEANSNLLHAQHEFDIANDGFKEAYDTKWAKQVKDGIAIMPEIYIIKEKAKILEQLCVNHPAIIRAFADLMEADANVDAAVHCKRRLNSNISD